MVSWSSSARDAVPGQLGQGFAPKTQQDVPVDAWEKCADVELVIPALAGLPHEVLQPFNGFLRAFVFAVGIAVVNKAFVPPRLNMPHQPLMHQAVDKRRGKNFAQLGVGDRKHGEWLGLVSPLRDVFSLRQHQRWQGGQVSAFVFAVARIGGAFKQLIRDGFLYFVYQVEAAVWSVRLNIRKSLRTC